MPGSQKPDVAFYAGWVLATAAGYVLGFALAAVIGRIAVLVVGPDVGINGVRQITDDYLTAAVRLPLISVTVGGLQAMVLRRYLARAGWWIAATLLGWVLASRLVSVRPDILAWLVGFAIAAPQWLVLRRRLPESSLWLLASTALSIVQFPLLVAAALYGPAQSLTIFRDVWGLAFIPACGAGIVLGALLSRATTLSRSGGHSTA